MKLDIYNHIFPVKYFERMQEVIPNKGPIKRWLNIPVLYDVDARLRMMDSFGEYQQILSNSMPPIEFIAGPDRTPELARLANDGMAELCRRYPDRFPSFIASLPMNNMDSDGGRDRPRHRRARRLRRADLQPRQQPAARRARVLPAVREDGGARSADLAASGARRQPSGLPDRGQVEIRDLVDLRLALRDLGRDGPDRVFRRSSTSSPTSRSSRTIWAR